jgi:hypothetical protein
LAMRTTDEGRIVPGMASHDERIMVTGHPDPVKRRSATSAA